MERRAGRDCADAVYRQAGITDPVRELDVAELFVPYSWMEPVLLENLGGPGTAYSHWRRSLYGNELTATGLRRAGELSWDRTAEHVDALLRTVVG